MQLDIVVLTKDNLVELASTLRSIPCPSLHLKIRVIVVDGSRSSDRVISLLRSPANAGIFTEYVNSYSLGVYGIYPCMNLALQRVRSDWFIFMNSGDYFSPNFKFESVTHLLGDPLVNIVFGQAIVHGSDARTSCAWVVPCPRIKNIKHWLRYFEPCHQAMFVRGYLANTYSFDIGCPIGSDALWKRKLLSNEPFAYHMSLVCIFTLGGLSTTYTYKNLLIKLSEASRRPIEKIMEIIKYLLFGMGLMSPRLQMLKSEAIGRLF